MLTAATAWSRLRATAADAQEKLKIGLLTTLSGPPAVLGQQQRNGFQLALKTLGGKLGGREVELIVEDDELKPDRRRQQGTGLWSSATRSISSSARCSPISSARSLKPVTDSGNVHDQP